MSILIEHSEDVLKKSSDFVDGYIKALRDVNKEVKLERRVDLNYDLTAMLILIKSINKEAELFDNIYWNDYKKFKQISTDRIFKLKKSQDGYYLQSRENSGILETSCVTKTYSSIDVMQDILEDEFIPIK